MNKLRSLQKNIKILNNVKASIKEIEIWVYLYYNYIICIIISTIMSDVDQLANLINGILQSEDKTKRESAEQTLVGLRASNPNELMLAFLIILAGTIFF